MFAFGQWSLWRQAGVFAVSAVVVCVVAARLAGYAASVADRTGGGQTFGGLILLGVITSLPELAVSVAASRRGLAVFALNDVLGSVVAQVTLLALADALIGRMSRRNLAGSERGYRKDHMDEPRWDSRIPTQ